ncbi:hypothetical protein KP509_08G019500 [Ceratopteris richardii]|nr:hypothetical protein KP509_08G019500 [Ceratopteris richardii]
MLPQHDMDAYTEFGSKPSKPSRPSKVRRYLFFWGKQSNMSHSQAEVEYGGKFSSVPHPTSHISDKGKARGYTTYSSRTSVRKGTSGPINHQPGARMKGNSSPLYTDGLPDGPYNLKQPRKSYSGPIGYNNYESYSSPYRPLHGYPTASPLYSC